MPDPEVAAMSTVVDAVGKLPDEEARARVLKWAADRFGVVLGSSRRPRTSSESDDDGDGEDGGGARHQDFEEFVDLFDRMNPRTDLERALCGAYWLQVIKGNSSWASQQVNDMLKDTGHGIGNITRTLDQAQARRPALVRQVAKSGRAKQARKTYKLTTAGLSLVSGRIGGSAVAEEDEE